MNSVAFSGSSPNASRSSAASSVLLRSISGVANRRQGMQVGDEIETIVVFLQVDVLANRAEEVSPVRATGRLDP